MKFFNKVYTFLLTEANKKTVATQRDTDSLRKERASRVKFIKWLKIVPSTARQGEILPKSWKKYEYKCLSHEKTEGRTHEGYLTLDKQNSVRDCFCSCADFQFRWRYALVIDDMAKWQTPDKFTNIETNAPHTREPSHITNPDYQKRFCKHLTAAMNKIKRN